MNRIGIFVLFCGLVSLLTIAACTAVGSRPPASDNAEDDDDSTPARGPCITACIAEANACEQDCQRLGGDEDINLRDDVTPCLGRCNSMSNACLTRCAE